ncbi:Na(+)/H(+) antiporter NhaA, partial [termite gut metagenome]
MQVSRAKRYSSFMNLWGSILLFTAAILAACVANSPLLPVYQEFLSYPVILQVGNFNLFSHKGEPLSILELINDGLMT